MSTSKFQSPGIFTEEIDRSFVEQDVEGTVATLVGSTEKGPAFVPTRVTNFQEYFERFGSLDENMQASYAARNFLRNSSNLDVVRVLGHADGGSAPEGYTLGSIVGITDTSASDGQVLAVIHASTSFAAVQVSGVVDDEDRFVVTIGDFAATASFVTSSADYIGKTLNTDPTRFHTDEHYVYQLFPYAEPAASASWHTIDASGSLTDFTESFSAGSTPWVISQLLGGNEYELFKFHTLGHGRATNDDVKVSIQNVKPSPNPGSRPWGSFDVVVRDFYDTDLKQSTLETFVNLSLDPDDRNYILRRIGDQDTTFDTDERKFVTTGRYPNRSRHIRVELNKNSGAPDEAVPWGFRGYDRLSYETNATAMGSIPDLEYRVTQQDKQGSYNETFYWGVQFVSGGVVDRMRALPSSPITGSDADFSLKRLSGTYVDGRLRHVYDTSTTSYEPILVSASIQKFTLPLAGGFDGWDLRVEDNLHVDNNADESDIGVASLRRAIDTVANPDQNDMDVLAVPGQHNIKVTDKARDVANDRRDVVYVMDLTGSTVEEAVSNLQAREIDDNYTAAYYPDVWVDDELNNRVVRLAPSTVVVGTYAMNDRLAHPWFAPAGFNRGGLEDFNVTDVVDKLTAADKGELYDNRINPIASFPRVGISVLGQKTLQVAQSALDRVNVRRLLIFAKKTISDIARDFLFEPNDPTTYQRFTDRVNPVLETVRQNQGLDRFKVVMDTNTNTADLVDRNIMKGKIFLQPVRAAEFIALDFIVTASGVEFSD